MVTVLVALAVRRVEQVQLATTLMLAVEAVAPQVTDMDDPLVALGVPPTTVQR